MSNGQDISNLIQCHNAIEHFEYDLVVDWAIELIRKGVETDNILMLASFSKPVDSHEIRPYVNAVLTDLGLEKKEGDDAIITKTHYHLQEILSGFAIRKHLHSLYKLSLENDHEHGLLTFYLIWYGWNDLDDSGVNYYSEGTDPNSIEQELKQQAHIWIEKYVTGKENVVTND